VRKKKSQGMCDTTIAVHFNLVRLLSGIVFTIHNYINSVLQETGSTCFDKCKVVSDNLLM